MFFRKTKTVRLRKRSRKTMNIFRKMIAKMLKINDEIDKEVEALEVRAEAIRLDAQDLLKDKADNEKVIKNISKLLED